MKFSDQLISRYNRPVPRYTSYPPANHFRNDLDFESLFAGDRLDQPLCLYFHLPFCPSQCWYCGCNNLISSNPGLISRYVDRLIEEIRLYTDRFPSKGEVVQIQWGGGSPTALQPSDITKLGEAIRSCFKVSGDAEFSIEMDPRHVDVDRAGAFAQIGCTRASLGVQDLNLIVQAAINRIQPPHVVEAALEHLQEKGIRNFSFDLVYGLPVQNVTSFAQTLQQIKAWRPGRVSLFAYAHIPWMKPEQRRFDRQDSLPEAETRMELFTHAVESLEEGGYHWIGLDHFAHPEDALAQAQLRRELRRNFQGYTTHRHTRVVGFGLSSISTSESAFRQNSKGLRQYLKSVADGSLPIERGYLLTGEDRNRGRLIELLMTDLSLDFESVREKHQIDPAIYLRGAEEDLSRLAEDGMIEFDDQGLRVTRNGRFFLRSIAHCLDAYRHQQNPATPRHAQAV